MARTATATKPSVGKQLKSIRKRVNKLRAAVFKFYHLDKDNKDPKIDQLKTIIEDQYGDCDWSTLNKISEHVNIHPSTMWQWFWGKTCMPKNATIGELAGFLGWEIELVKKHSGPNVIQFKKKA